mmetsp:Transcript_3705/g.8826  ORF Transcript_3705/g.8826 Transcript_3705/m.8826 type:complete len:340 (+) Transcript_3705:586-1605(+)
MVQPQFLGKSHSGIVPERMDGDSVRIFTEGGPDLAGPRSAVPNPHRAVPLRGGEKQRAMHRQVHARDGRRVVADHVAGHLLATVERADRDDPNIRICEAQQQRLLSWGDVQGADCVRLRPHLSGGGEFVLLGQRGSIAAVLLLRQLPHGDVTAGAADHEAPRQGADAERREVFNLRVLAKRKLDTLQQDQLLSVEEVYEALLHAKSHSGSQPGVIQNPLIIWKVGKRWHQLQGHLPLGVPNLQKPQALGPTGSNLQDVRLLGEANPIHLEGELHLAEDLLRVPVHESQGGLRPLRGRQQILRSRAGAAGAAFVGPAEGQGQDPGRAPEGPHHLHGPRVA